MNILRLQQLLNHMEQRRTLDAFDFGSIYYVSRDRLGKSCKTAGCMLGEFPACWPGKFQHGPSKGWDAEIHYRSDTPELAAYKDWLATADRSVRQSMLLAAHWLECSIEDALWCFAPDTNHYDLGDNNLTIFSPLEHVLQRLRDMIAFRETGLAKKTPLCEPIASKP